LNSDRPKGANFKFLNSLSEESGGCGKLKRDLIYKAAFLGILSIVIIFLIAHYMPYGVDWRNVFRPAAQAVLRLESPFSVEGYFNAPWAVLPLIPLAILPESISYGLLVLLSMIGFAYTAYRLGARPIVVVAVLLSPPVLHSLLNGNIDALAVLGFVLPPQIGLFFLLIKPQIGMAVAFYWFIERWRQAGIREVVRIFTPILFALILSFILFGLWPLQFEQEIDLWWNASLWPASIPVGLVLLVVAFRRRRMEYAMAASPCLSPYVLLHAWVGALLALVSQVPETLTAVLGLWILVLLRAL
jgi:hypothetical protein